MSTERKILTHEKLLKLAEPIDPLNWKVQAIQKQAKTCVVVPYIDARQAQQRFDDVCGITNWANEHKEEKGNMYCRIGINTDVGWVWKSDVGKESHIEKEKGESSDSFKRAAVHWGVGRFLYDMDAVILPAKEGKGQKWYACTHSAKQLLAIGINDPKAADVILYNNETLTRYVTFYLEAEAKHAARVKAEEEEIANMPDYKSK